MINPVLGIDTWQGQLEIDEAVLKANKVAFIFVRLNDMNGGHHMDTGFAKQWAEAAGFYRAPYFVYNPWVSGMANFLWLAANMPADAKAVAIDIEVIMSGYSPALYGSEVSRFEALVKSKWNYVIYTGQAYLPLLSAWNTNADYWWAQYPNEFYNDPNLPKTWDDVRARLMWYAGPSNASKIPGRLKFWQFSGDRLVLPGNPHAMDVNVFFGSEAQLADFFGGIPAASVEHTQTAPGVDEYTEVVNGVRCHITLMDMTNKTIHIGHFPNSLGYVSQVAKATGALVAFNGIDYNKKIAPPIPYGPAYTAGVAANSLNPEFRYFLNFSPSNDVTFTFKNFTAFYNTTSFVRPLVIDGAMAPDIRDNPGKIEYTEIHACAAFGYCRDGRLIQIAAEGKVDPATGKAYQGITVPQMVSLLLKYGALNAGQHGGGGDVVKAINGTVINSFSDPQERAVAQVIYVTGATMANGIAKEKLGNNTRVRKTPSRYGVVVTTLSPYQQVNFTEKVPALAPTATTPADKAGEIWLKLTDGNYVNYKLYNTSNVLQELFTIVQEPTIDPVPTEPSVFISHTFNDTLTLNGVTYTATFTVPNVEYKPNP